MKVSTVRTASTGHQGKVEVAEVGGRSYPSFAALTHRHKVRVVAVVEREVAAAKAVTVGERAVRALR
jgi:hypothetical protein